MKHRELIEKMTVEEKAAVLSGRGEWQSREVKRLGIPSIFCADGPHGIRKQEGEGDHLGLNASLPATCFPTAATVANSWDEKLGEEVGRALGEEAAVLGVDVLLGPGLNIKRSPLCGRNFEYFSEDPYLSGKMTAAYIRGIQSQGVYACPKHFAVNSQELRRMAMNSVLDERTMREIYLTGFEIAVKEGNAGALMTSYNQVNGTYANENEHLLKDILRGEWDFDGMVVTDWGGSNDHVRGAAMRSNLEMPAPGLDSAREILAALESGRLTEEELDACVADLLNAVMDLKEKRAGRISEFDWEAHHQIAAKAARESIVLLKNTEVDGELILPLKSGCSVALIGDFAMTPRYQGAGSSLVNATRVESLESMIEKYPLTYAGYQPGYRRTGEESEELKRAALELAEKAEVVVYCFGLNEVSEVEGMDREHMRIPQNQISLLAELVKVNPNIVGILNAGSAVEMPWHHCLRGILHGYLGGQAGAGAMLDVLTGKANPSGRLAETYPVKYEDTPAFRYFPSVERNAEYREGLFVGYRYFDTRKTKVQYPFGYGLSYTSFTYGELQVTEDGAEFTIANVGERDGAEVVQLYIGGPRDAIYRPEKELKGFAKVFLKAGEQKRVRIPFDDKTFRYWNTKTDRWETEAGTYTVFVGSNVSDIRLQGKIRKAGTTGESPYEAGEMPHYFEGDIQRVPDEEFETLLGMPIPSGKWDGELGLNDTISQLYYAKSWIARLIYRIMTDKKKKNEEQGKPDLNLLFQYNIPFRGIAKMTGGLVSMEMAQGAVLVVNGHFFRGMGKIVGGFFRNRKANREYEKKLSGQ